MIISFSVENWMSFYGKATLSMVASRERQHREHVPRVDRYHIGVLPVAAVYGGNASGKSNLVAALAFAQALVVEGTRPDELIPVDRFLLNSKGMVEPVRFAFELLIDEAIYEFSFAVTEEAVEEERLVKVSSNTETTLYDRKGGKIHLDRSMDQDPFLEFAFRGTRDNQLFLTNAVSQKVDAFKPVHDWFRTTLRLITPETRYGTFDRLMDEKHPLSSGINTMLPALDTGITHLGAEEVALEDTPIPREIKTVIMKEVKEGVTATVMSEKGDRFVVSRSGGELKKLAARRMVTYHRSAEGKEVKFEMRQESDGSLRVIDLLPAFLTMRTPGAKGVYIIDELDRSLHTLLTRSLLEFYLSGCSTQSRAQLVFTTHDVFLMDQRLLRRDEMWVTERDGLGASMLRSFSEYKDVRLDKDIRKSYLQGRLGGVPRILAGSLVSDPECQDQDSENP